MPDTKSLEAVWRELVTPTVIYDELAFRMAFLNSDEEEIFGVVDSLTEPTALLPLQRNKVTGQIRFLGTPFLERNRSFWKPGCESEAISLYQTVITHNPNFVFDDIAATDAITTTEHCTDSDDYFVYDLAAKQITSINDVPGHISDKRLRRSMSAVLAQVGPTIKITSVSLAEASSALKKIAFERFGADSWLENNYIQKAITGFDTLPTEQPTKPSAFLLYVNNICVGGHIGLGYNNVYYALFSAAVYNETTRDIPKLVHLLNFKGALSTDCATVDTGIGDCGWKTSWGFIPQKQYKFII